jgi:signal transduction histidine kinase
MTSNEGEFVTADYLYSPGMWPPLTAAFFLASLSLYGWRRRSVPGALQFAIGSLLGATLLLAAAFEVAATAADTKIVWYKVQMGMTMPAVSVMTCFALEYSYPGRWLTRRNLSLLAVLPLLLALLIAINDSQFMWSRVQVGADGAVGSDPTTLGAILLGSSVALVLINVAAFVWLFAKSPQHRWPAALMLFGLIGSRGVYLLDFLDLRAVIPLDPLVASTLLAWTLYAIALFGFRIFDPLTMARRIAIEQSHVGMLVLDELGRIAGLNHAAERILHTAAGNAMGKPVGELLSTYPEGCQGAGDGEIELTLPVEGEARIFALAISRLKDWRELEIGRLLLLRDVTEQKRTQAQIVEQQRSLAVLQERERLARELHDDLGQVLGYVKMQARAARERLTQNDQGAADEYLAQLIGVVQDAHTDVREYILSAKQTPGVEFDLLAALERYLRQYTMNYGIQAALISAPGLSSGAFEPMVQAQLLRIVQEALTNARKHARAKCVQVHFSRIGGRVQVIVQDDGSGFDPQEQCAAEGRHYGLGFMRERAEEVGGNLEVISSPGHGTQVVVDVPVKQSTRS